MKAPVFEIKRFAVHDGDGIRTTVFLKGCTLKCVWCHNPEGIGFESEAAFWENKCTLCGECVNVCSANAHRIENGVHIFERDKCVACGKCEDACLNCALTLYGKEMTVDEVMPILLEDKDFYDNSDGGVTISGGECLCHADFCAELLKRLKENEINTAVDTCGFVSRKAIDKVMRYTDVFLYDLKAYDEDVHIKCTGQPNGLILENLKYLDECGKKIEIRIPYVPNFNDNQLIKIAEFLSKFQNITKVRVLPYHNYAGSKYAALNMKNTLPEIMPTNNDIIAAEASVKEQGLTL